MMKNLIKVSLMVLVILMPVHAELDTSYFQLGDWKLGQKRKALLSEQSPFLDMREIVKKKQYSANVDTVFSKNTPSILFFKRARLHRLELTLYEGASYDEASEATKQLISVLSDKFGGASLEGFTTSEGLEPKIFDDIVKQLLDQSKEVMAGINETDGKSDAYFSLYISVSTEYSSRGNFIYGKFSYFGKTGTYNLTVFEDKKYNEKHFEDAMILIGSNSVNE